MNIKDINIDIKKNTPTNILLELATGVGKTKCILDIIKYYQHNSILVVVPKRVLINNWKDEIHKWNYDGYLSNIEFICYNSFKKDKLKHYNIIIFDEAHHISDRIIKELSQYKYADNYFLLSATINKNKMFDFYNIFKPIKIYNIDLNNAIESNKLPTPNLVLLQLELDEKQRNEYNKMMEEIIYLQRNQNTIWNTRKYLRKCLDRNIWLSNQKTLIIKQLLKLYSHYRTITFCNSIKQTKEFSSNCINSKNINSTTILDKFNSKKINHITACNMLDEGVNLSNCQVGIFAMLSASNRLILQRIGRILRHSNPIIIIPYYTNTRDEEIVNKMLIDCKGKILRCNTNSINRAKLKLNKNKIKKN